MYRITIQVERMSDKVWTVLEYFLSIDDKGELQACKLGGGAPDNRCKQIDMLIAKDGPRAILDIKQFKYMDHYQQFSEYVGRPGIEQWFGLWADVVIIDDGHIFNYQFEGTMVTLHERTEFIVLDTRKSERIVRCTERRMFAEESGNISTSDIAVIIGASDGSLRCCILKVHNYDDHVTITNENETEYLNVNTICLRMPCFTKYVQLENGMIPGLDIGKIHHVYREQYVVAGDANPNGTYNMYKINLKINGAQVELNTPELVSTIVPVSRHKIPVKNAYSRIDVQSDCTKQLYK